MTDKEKIKVLKKCFDDIIWMAIRYAHGRNTYSPDMVRDAVSSFKLVSPEWKMREDITIEKPDKLMGYELPSDYLNDLFDE